MEPVSHAADTKHEHPSFLAHHYHSPRQQAEAGKLGMWIFLVTEVLLFGGLFCAYAVYRANHPEIFIYAHQFLDKTLGGVNTVVLICSSLTMALAVYSAQRGLQRSLVVCLVLTLLFACGFLGIKYVEYKQKWEHGLLLGKWYKPVEHGNDSSGPAPVTTHPATATAPATRQTTMQPAAAVVERSAIAPPPEGPAGLARHATSGAHDGHGGKPPNNVQIFFGIYFLMTGLHGLHVIAGMIAITWILVRSSKGEFSGAYFAPVDLVGLYWHLVDIIWIFLFPLLYLIH
jgi:cytochrome c oxidase subunit 3